MVGSSRGLVVLTVDVLCRLAGHAGCKMRLGVCESMLLGVCVGYVLLRWGSVGRELLRRGRLRQAGKQFCNQSRLLC